MKTSRFTPSEILDYITHGDLYLVRYGDKVYVLSKSRLGSEDFDFGVYDADLEWKVSSGRTSLDVVPDFFLSDFIWGVLFESGQIPYEYQTILEETPLRDWYRFLVFHNILVDPQIEDISRIVDERMVCKSETVTRFPTNDEVQCIIQYEKTRKSGGEL